MGMSSGACSKLMSVILEASFWKTPQARSGKLRSCVTSCTDVGHQEESWHALS